MEHRTHEDHPHQHGPGCGHQAVEHNDHVDYLHDGHRHVAHDDHWDECPVAQAPDSPTERALGAL
ncbi:MAG TPA: hypothetical protein VKV06_11075 [Acidimicrobiales bacterium]|nr:hypothetical protein [Acidimicrobiales bacterium]